MYNSNVLCKAYQNEASLKGQLTRYIKYLILEIEEGNSCAKYWHGELKHKRLRILNSELKEAQTELKALN